MSKFPSHAPVEPRFPDSIFEQLMPHKHPDRKLWRRLWEDAFRFPIRSF